MTQDADFIASAERSNQIATHVPTQVDETTTVERKQNSWGRQSLTARIMGISKLQEIEQIETSSLHMTLQTWIIVCHLKH
jgi:hypothetical protein